MEIYRGGLSGSTPRQNEESSTEQREMGSHTVTIKTSANLMWNSGAGMALQNCPKLGQGVHYTLLSLTSHWIQCVCKKEE